MNQRTKLEAQIQRWTEAGLIDAQTGARILTFEAGQERRVTLRWPVFLAMIFGGILFAAGVTLFVAAHWSELSPAMRFSLVLLMAGLFHISGAVLTDRPPLSLPLKLCAFFRSESCVSSQSEGGLKQTPCKLLIMQGVLCIKSYAQDYLWIASLEAAFLLGFRGPSQKPCLSRSW